MWKVITGWFCHRKEHDVLEVVALAHLHRMRNPHLYKETDNG